MKKILMFMVGLFLICGLFGACSSKGSDNPVTGGQNTTLSPFEGKWVSSGGFASHVVVLVFSGSEFLIVEANYVDNTFHSTKGTFVYDKDLGRITLTHMYNSPHNPLNPFTGGVSWNQYIPPVLQIVTFSFTDADTLLLDSQEYLRAQQ